MADSYKDLIITPFRGNTADPKFEFRGANSTVNTTITLTVYPDSNGTLSFDGSAGQLFSITNDLSGILWSVNDISGIPSAEIDANGNVRFAQFGGNVSIGTANNTYKLEVNGDTNITGNIRISGNTVINSAGYWVGNLAGLTGYTGSIGFTGSLGFTGSKGDIGYTGSLGFTGSQGVIGFTGSKGEIGYTGSIGSQGYTGSIGFTGSIGTQGYTGSIGFTGSKGDIGYTGSIGTQGYTGSIGFTGSIGTQGYTGSIGFTGSQGPIGYTGSIGFTGSIGLQGYTGSIGFTGSKGDTGTTGFTGSKGDIGFTGSQGLQGYTGSIGFTGSIGNIGFTGSIGATGFTGSVGFTGSRGVTGFTGSIGFTGSVGPTGGATTQVLFNDAGTTAGDADFIFLKANNALVVANLNIPGIATFSSDNLLIGNVSVNITASNTDITKNSVSVIPFGQQTIWVPAAAMTARTTAGAAAGTLQTTTNAVMLKTFDFDTTTQEFVQFAIQMPKSWDEGTIIAQFLWSHPTTTTNFGVVWALQAVSFADADALDTAFGTEQTATDTGGTANTIYISPETAAITVAGTPAAEEYVVFQAKRNPADGSDTMAVDARLHGVKIHYTTNAAKDD